MSTREDYFSLGKREPRCLTFPPGKRDFNRNSLYSEKFPVERTKKRVHLHPNRNFRSFLVSGKRPELWPEETD